MREYCYFLYAHFDYCSLYWLVVSSFVSGLGSVFDADQWGLAEFG